MERNNFNYVRVNGVVFRWLNGLFKKRDHTVNFGWDFLLYPHHKMWGGGAIMDSLCRVRPSVRPSSVRRSVGRSVSIIVSALQILYQLKGFLQTWQKCSPQQEDVQNPCCPRVSSRSRSQLKVKYQKNQILDIMSCPLCKSYTNRNIFFNLGSNVYLNKGMCRTHVSLYPA